MPKQKMTEFEKLVAKTMSNAFMDVPTAVVKPKPAKKPRLAQKLDRMTDDQKRILLLMLTGELATLSIKGETYAYRRVSTGYVIRSLHDSEPEHTVTEDFSACSCEDCRFRGRVCKHMTALKGVLSA